MSPALRRKLDRLALVLAAMIGAGLLLVGIALMNEAVYAQTTIHIGLFGADGSDPPDRSSYLPGLLMTVSGAGLLGFAIGHSISRPRDEKIDFLDKV